MGEETAAPARKARRFDAHGGVLRRGRIFARLREGPPMTKSPGRNRSRRSEAPPDRAREALAWRFVDDETDHAKLQVARLAQAMQIASVAVADGDVKAIPALLKVIDRVDRYQRAAKVNEVYDEEARKRLMDKINRVAANLGYDDAGTAIEGPASGARIRGKRLGKRTRKKKCGGGSPQAFSIRLDSGDGNPRISFALLWSGFAR